MRVLITGGLGNLGSWITKHLVEQKFQVTTLSNSGRDIPALAGVENLYCSVHDKKELDINLGRRRWDVIIHLASINDDNFEGYATKALEVNTLGTRNLLESISRSENPHAHFIYFSTFHVYGLNAGTISEDTVLPEPKNDYASTHLFAEYYVKQFHHSLKIPYTIFRLTNSYGCPLDRNSSKWHLVLNDLARTAVEKQILTLKSNGKPRRDFIWMGDVCTVVEQCIRKGAANSTFNLGSGISMSMLELAELVKKAYEDFYSRPIAININHSDTNKYNSNLRVDTGKLRSHISFEPRDKMYEEVIKIFKMLEE